MFLCWKIDRHQKSAEISKNSAQIIIKNNLKLSKNEAVSGKSLSTFRWKSELKNKIFPHEIARIQISFVQENMFALPGFESGFGRQSGDYLHFLKQNSARTKH